MGGIENFADHEEDACVEVLGWILWTIALVVGLSWSYGVRTYVRTGQGVQQATVNQTTLILLAVVAVPLLGLSPFHLLWMLPAAFIVGMLSLAFPFSLVSIIGKPFGELCCLGLDRDALKSRPAQFRSPVVQISDKERVASDLVGKS